MYALIHLVAMWELQNDHYTNLGRTGAVGHGQDWKRWHTEMGKHVRRAGHARAERWRL